MALERLTSDAADRVTSGSDQGDGPTAGRETVDPLELLGRVLTNIPDKGQVMQRYYGWYANRPRGMRRTTSVDTADAPDTTVVLAAPVVLSIQEARRRWAELVRRIYEAPRQETRLTMPFSGRRAS